jgi:anti-anti-sigma factor
MVPKQGLFRLSINMLTIDSHCQTWEQPVLAAVVGRHKESKLKLSLEVRHHGEIVVVHCRGRIVYRDEAAALSRVVGEMLHDKSKVVLDLSGVRTIDSAGIGELVLLETWAQERNAELKCSGANRMVLRTLSLMHLDMVIALYPTLDEALDSFREGRVRADSEALRDGLLPDFS